MPRAHCCSHCHFEVLMDNLEEAKDLMARHILMCPNHPLHRTKKAADALASYAATCSMGNSLDWMEGMAKALNDYLEAVGDSDRVATFGHSLSKITAEEYSLYDSQGFPKQ